MDDLISRQAVIEVIDAVFPVDPMKSEYAQGIACGAALAKTYVEQLPSAQQWIPCSERLPDQNGKYLVVGRRKAINILKFDGGRWYGKWGVVAWMPLPDCYQGDGNNEM